MVTPRVGIVAAICTVCALLVPPAARAATPSAWTPRAATYSDIVERDHEITMRDGVVIRADVIRPSLDGTTAAPGTFPVILTQTPYNKEAPELNFRSDYLVERGYTQVIADVRGTGDSGGQWASFDQTEQDDYAEVAHWAVTQPWSNGSLALHGTSYGAITAELTAEGQPAGLKAMFPIVPMGDGYRDIVFSGGTVNTSFIPLWQGLVAGGGFAGPAALGAGQVGAVTVPVDHAQGAATFEAMVNANALSGGDLSYDGPFWRTRSPYDRLDKVNVPTFVVGGEYDLFQRGEPMIYQKLVDDGVPARLLIGPWTHLQASSGQGLPADGVPTLDELELRWFDHYVKGVADPTLDTDIPPVTTYDLGTKHFVADTAYPSASTHYQQLLLGQGGALGTSPSTGSDLLHAVPAAGACSKSTVQWSAGAGGDVGGVGSTPCDTDNATNDALGLTYDLPVTGKPLVLEGPMAAHVYVSSSQTEGHITARVEDVAPDGTVTQLSAGWQTLSFRALDSAKSLVRDGLVVRPWHDFTPASQEAVVPDKVYDVQVEIFPTHATVEPGHSLRLSMQTGDSPHLTPPATMRPAIDLGNLTFVHDAAHRSALVVGVVGGASALKAAAPGSSKAPAAVRKPSVVKRVSAPTRGLAATGAPVWLSGVAALCLGAAVALRRRRA